LQLALSCGVSAWVNFLNIDDGNKQHAKPRASDLHRRQHEGNTMPFE
jgi:hypothetical protein